jgi:hypothetical protein
MPVGEGSQPTSGVTGTRTTTTGRGVGRAANQQGVKNMRMRFPVVLLTAAGLGFSATAPAHAIGCLTGGIAGAVAGHMAHHGVLGAIGGCVAGHAYNKHQKRAAAQRQSNANQSNHANGTQANSR